MSIIEVKSINRSFRDGDKIIHVLKDVSLSVEAGTFNIIMGPSGSGKTTLLNIIGALDLPDSGNVIIDGEDIISGSEHVRERVRRKKIGFVFQSIALISNMSAYENIDYALRINDFNSGQRKMRILESLDYVELEKRVKHKPYELSGGEQQRVAIARAIAHRPYLLLADEPTAELDTKTGLKIIKLFRKLVEEENMTIIMCTHDASVIEVADNVFKLIDGVLVNDRNSEEYN